MTVRQHPLATHPECIAPFLYAPDCICSRKARGKTVETVAVVFPDWDAPPEEDSEEES